MRIVSTNNIKENMVLGKNVYDNRGLILLRENTNLSNNYIKNLKSKNIPAIYVKDSFSKDIDIEEAIDVDLKASVVNSVNSTFSKLVYKKEIPSNNSYPIMDDMSYNKIKDVVNLLLENINKNKGLLFNMIEVMSTDLATYTHSVNVAILSILTGKSMHFSESQLVDIGIGALLHDIGKTRIPIHILNKKEPLNKDEFNIIKKHVEKGYELVRDNKYISSHAKSIILNHHERIDGSGYPSGIKDEQIHIYVRIVSLCDTFDALITDRVYRDRIPIYKALELINSQLITKLDEDVYKHLEKNISVFPNGIGVKLNTGEKAIVLRQNKDYPTRPLIRLIYDHKGNLIENHYQKDLMQDLTVFVENTTSID